MKRFTSIVRVMYIVTGCAIVNLCPAAATTVQSSDPHHVRAVRWEPEYPLDPETDYCRD